MAPKDIKFLTDILHIAIEREKQANIFYKQLAQKVKNPPVVKFLLDLAEEENEHKELLELEFQKTGLTLIEKNIDDLDLQEIPLDYPDIDKLTPKQALEIAIAKEKSAFRFYVGLGMLINEQLAKEACLELAEQEAKHKAILELQLELL